MSLELEAFGTNRVLLWKEADSKPGEAQNTKLDLPKRMKLVEAEGRTWSTFDNVGAVWDVD